MKCMVIAFVFINTELGQGSRVEAAVNDIGEVRARIVTLFQVYLVDLTNQPDFVYI
jgi:hypothetical protein